MRLTIDLSRFDVDLLANRHEAAQRFVDVTWFSGMDVDVIFKLPASIVSTRSYLLPRANKEPVSTCVVAIPTSSLEPAAAPTSSPLQRISNVAIIIVVVVVVVVIG